MPYLLPFSVCAFLYLILLILFTFCAEETLSKEEIENARDIKKQMTVFLLSPPLLARNQHHSPQVRVQVLHVARTAAAPVQLALRLLLHSPQQGSLPHCDHLRTLRLQPDLLRHHLPAHAHESATTRRVRHGCGRGELDQHHRRHDAGRHLLSFAWGFT